MNQYNPRDIPIRSEDMVKQVVIYENGVATVNYMNGTSELVKNVVYSDTFLAVDEGDKAESKEKRKYKGKRAMISDNAVDDISEAFEKKTDEAIRLIGRSRGF